MLPAAALVAFAVMSGCSSSDSGNKVTNPPTTEPFESGTLGGGATFVHTFATAGSFGYRCRFHAIMTGTVTVAGGGADSALILIVNRTVPFPAPSVGSLPIKPGGYVRWVNNDGTGHTVTRP
jgi:plastocyanin